jgi:hypothetical protein
LFYSKCSESIDVNFAVSLYLNTKNHHRISNVEVPIHRYISICYMNVHLFIYYE